MISRFWSRKMWWCDGLSHLPFFETSMQEISLLPVKCIGLIPFSDRPAVAETLATEFRNATHHGLWSYARLHMFPKAVLRCPPRRGKKKRVIVKVMLLSQLELWNSADLLGLWSEGRLDADSRKSIFPKTSSVEQANRKRALAYAKEGRCREAIRSLALWVLSIPATTRPNKNYISVTLLTLYQVILMRFLLHCLPVWMQF